jgi:preprotein translocase subunit SecA
MLSIFKSFKGRHYRKFLRKCRPVVTRINEWEEKFQSLTDNQLQAKTAEYKERFRQGETLDDLLPEAFAAVKNAARRLCGSTIMVCEQEIDWEMVHYDVQLIGGIALHERYIAEMATGEGKTLVSTCPLYLNALTEQNCQLVTVNDYLARRDSHWMGAVFEFLGLTVGCIQNSMDPSTRIEMYSRDITYGTASEFGFDYLRDNGMASSKEDQVQRDHFFCIIDEADSILVDEARTPLIISGPMQEERAMPFPKLKPVVKRLVDAQAQFCNRYAEEGRRVLMDESSSEEARDEATAKLYQVRQGMPTHKQIFRLMEDPAARKDLEKFELEMHSDYNKTRDFELKEELFYVVDEKNHQADLTEKGRHLINPEDSEAFVIPDLPNLFMEIDKDSTLDDEAKVRGKEEVQQDFEKKSEEIHCVSQLLRAYGLYEKDKQYVVQNGKVMIVDENTGRLMPGRRWSNGLHQAVEAKEGVAIEKETKTYATITIQNYFRMYEKLSGMTGTAETEAGEFHDIYRLGVMVIPTNRPCIREDLNDLMFKTRRQKYKSVIEDIEQAHRKGQPILVGTASVESSEVLSRMLRRLNVPHSVLNAKYHEQEAEIVTNAGRNGAVTIATNMAGRGTDIKLGEGVPELGGLLVLGTERHESRRTDRQLRGRCARQGDLGMSRFYVSLEDDLMRIFANQGAISKMLEKSFGEEDILEGGSLNWAIENAQKKVEQQNYSIRKRLLQYDDVLNRQREIVYDLRNDAIREETPRRILFELVEEELNLRLESVVEPKGELGEEFESFLSTWLNVTFPVSVKLDECQGKPLDQLKEHLLKRIQDAYDAKIDLEEPDAIEDLERYVLIHSVDIHWQEHLTEMEDLRRSVGLRGYGQKNPLSEYKSEAYLYFEELMRAVQSDVCSGMFRSSTSAQSLGNMLSILSQNAKLEGPSDESPADGILAAAFAGSGDEQEAAASARSVPAGVPARRNTPKVGRNEPCPCGSGKKFKKCCA